MTVASNGAGATGKFAATVGAQAYVNSAGKLTTDTTSAGTATKDPLAALDAAISSIEVSNMSKAQIIQQAGNSVLAKANQVPQQVLSLLQG